MHVTRKSWGMVATVLLLTTVSTAGTDTYIFRPEQSTIVQTGGIAGVHWTYSVEGQFWLSVDPDAGTASFVRVDANGTDNSPSWRTLDPNHVFSLTSLAGTIVRGGAISFAGKAPDGSDVGISVTFEENSIHLVGQTTPPPDSADFFVFSLDAVAQRKYGGGTGEPNDPFQIATAADLIALGETPDDYDKHFILTADIDLDPNLPDGRVFDKAVIADAKRVRDPEWIRPIKYYVSGKAFTGVFDGDGHTVARLTVKTQERELAALFGRLAGEVKNLAVADVNIAGSINPNEVGAVVAYNDGGVVSKCYSTGTVSSRDTVGGLVGYNHRGTVTQCYSKVIVSSGNYVGGLVGIDTEGSLTHCYSTGEVTGPLMTGGLVGQKSEGTIVTGCFWDTETSGQEDSRGGTGKTTAEMQTAKTFLEAGWDFIDETENGTDDIWWILDDQDYPRLWWELPDEN